MKHKFFYLYLFCVLLSGILYCPSFDNSFFGDDFVFLTHVGTADSLKAVLVPSVNFAFYRPGTIALFYLEYKLFGFSAGFYLAFNFIIHLLNSILLILIIYSLGYPKHTALLAGSLFVIGFAHYGKQIMFVCTSGPLFSVLLILLTILLAFRIARDYKGKSPFSSYTSRLHLLLIIVLLIIAPFFHESALLTPLFLIVSLRLTATPKPRPYLSLSYLLIPTLVWVLILIYLSRTYSSYISILKSSFGSPALFLKYLGFFLSPIQSSQVQIGAGSSLAQFIIRFSDYLHGLLGLLLAVVFSLALIRGKPGSRIMAMWLFLALLPVSLLKMPESWLELRYLYYPAIPFLALASDYLIKLLTSKSRFKNFSAAFMILIYLLVTINLVSLLERKYDRTGKSQINLETLDTIRTQISRRNR